MYKGLAEANPTRNVHQRLPNGSFGPLPGRPPSMCAVLNGLIWGKYAGLRYKNVWF